MGRVGMETTCCCKNARNEGAALLIYEYINIVHLINSSNFMTERTAARATRQRLRYEQSIHKHEYRYTDNIDTFIDLEY